MYPQTRWWERLVRSSPPHKTARPTLARIVSEPRFHKLIAVERARSLRRGYPCWILTVSLNGGAGAMTPMDGTFSDKVMAVLLGHLRTTDQIGWYREGWMIGALLTVIDRAHVERPCKSPDQRLSHILQLAFPDVADSLSVRMCKYDELP